MRKVKTSKITDRIPHSLFKQLWPKIIDYHTSVVNLSLQTGVFPTIYKAAALTPILKSPSVDVNCLASYRPVSNLPFLAKVLESAVAAQLTKHLDGYLSPFQSAFRAGHSVESTLTHVSSSVLQQLDSGHSVFIILYWIHQEHLIHRP